MSLHHTLTKLACFVYVFVLVASSATAQSALNPDRAIYPGTQCQPYHHADRGLFERRYGVLYFNGGSGSGLVTCPITIDRARAEMPPTRKVTVRDLSPSSRVTCTAQYIVVDSDGITEVLAVTEETEDSFTGYAVLDFGPGLFADDGAIAAILCTLPDGSGISNYSYAEDVRSRSSTRRNWMRTHGAICRTTGNIPDVYNSTSGFYNWTTHDVPAYCPLQRETSLETFYLHVEVDDRNATRGVECSTVALDEDGIMTYQATETLIYSGSGFPVPTLPGTTFTGTGKLLLASEAPALRPPVPPADRVFVRCTLPPATGINALEHVEKSMYSGVLN